MGHEITHGFDDQGSQFDKEYESTVDADTVTVTVTVLETHSYIYLSLIVVYSGKLRNWWTDEVKARFAEKTKCIEEQYGRYTVLNGSLHLNGKLTLGTHRCSRLFLPFCYYAVNLHLFLTVTGENIADNGGLKEAYSAFKAATADRPDDDIIKAYFEVRHAQFFFSRSLSLPVY